MRHEVVESSGAPVVMLAGADSVERWAKPEPPQYTCDIHVVPEPEGGYSVYVPRLPGVVSEGDDLEHALDNIAEALQGALRAYRACGTEIPWRGDTVPLPSGESRYRIRVSV